MRIKSYLLMIATGAALVTLAACHKDARSVDYFKAHEKEARSTVADCTSGKETGKECENAATAVAYLDRHDAIQKEIEEVKKHGG